MYLEIPTDHILADAANPRGSGGDTTDLQSSIRAVGLVNPLRVQGPDDDGHYRLIDGHRRLTAIRRLYESSGDARWQAVAAVVLPVGDTPTLATMLATNVRAALKPTRVGRAITRLSVEHSWPLEQCAAVLGLSPIEAQDYVKAAEAPESVQKRLDNGEIAWTTWRRRLSKLPKDMQEEVASIDAPTRDNVARKIKQMTQPADERMLDDESLIEKAQQARIALQEVLDARPWAESIEPRLAFIFEDIHHLTQPENVASGVNC